jgi:hypothetical protein
MTMKKTRLRTPRSVGYDNIEVGIKMIRVIMWSDFIVLSVGSTGGLWLPRQKPPLRLIRV